MIGYDELRHFMTAVGQNEVQKNLDQAHIPQALIPRQSEGALFQEGSDNINTDCQITDGNGIFHSMVKVIFKQHKNTTWSQQISYTASWTHSSQHCPALQETSKTSSSSYDKTQQPQVYFTLSYPPVLGYDEGCTTPNLSIEPI